MRLEVEIDHTHARGMITCWIFRVETTERTNLSVQQLYNFGQRARWGKDQGLRPEDETLVKLLWTIVSKPHILKANLKALKVPIPTFEGWLTRFADTPDRFIDRCHQGQRRAICGVRNPAVPARPPRQQDPAACRGGASG